MTTPSAWNTIADMFDGPPSEHTNRGLCKAIAYLERQENITPEQAQAMDTQIIAYKRHIGCYSAYIWPMGEVYRIHRAQLARQLGREAQQ